MFIKFLSASFYTIWHGIYRSGPELETNRNCDFTVQSPRKLAMLYFEYNRSFFLTQKHIYSLQYTGCSWFVSFYKCRDITIKNMLFMSLITVRLRDPPSHKDDHRENVQNDFFLLKNYIENGFKSIDIFDWMINPSPWLSINPCLPMLTCLLCKRIWWDAI